MDIDPRLTNDIRLAEAPGGKPALISYKDSRGFWTIGFGHLMANQDSTAESVIITAMRAEELLANDIASAKLLAAHTPEWQYLDTVCRCNAVVELVFNLGVSKWLLFAHCRDAIKNHQWQRAHDELLNSAWDHEVHEARANRIADYLLTGEYP